MTVDQNFVVFLKKELPTLLHDLEADTPAQWGQMSPQHMIEHLGGSFLIGTGKFPLQAAYDEEKLKRNYAYIIEGRNPFKRGVKVSGVVSEKPAPLRFGSLGEAKKKLLQAIETFFKHFEKQPDTVHLHPAFGDLGYADWIVFEAQHSKHHFLQFGLIDSY